MKRIKSELLDALLYVDREHTKPLYNPDIHIESEDGYTIREYLKVIIDLPIQDRKLTRELSKSIDKIYDSLDSGDLVLEDADFKIMAKQIEDVGLRNPVMYKQYAVLVDSAEEC